MTPIKSQQSGAVRLHVLIGVVYVIASAYVMIMLFEQGAIWTGWMVACLSVGVISWLWPSDPPDNKP